MAEASPRVRIALAWIDAFTNWNLSAIYSFVTQSSDFEYGYLPASAGIAPKSMVDWMIYNKVHKEVLPDFKCEVREFFECNGPIIARIIGRATSSTGAPFQQEYIMFIHIRQEPEGLRINKVEEFLDTGFARDFFAAERLRRIERKRASEGMQKRVDKVSYAKM